MTLTTDDLERAKRDDRWLGFGYLGERDSALDDSDPECPPRPMAVKESDEYVLRRAYQLGWDYDTLFHFLNSKNGRWFAESVIHDSLHSGDLAVRARKADGYLTRTTEFLPMDEVTL